MAGTSRDEKSLDGALSAEVIIRCDGEEVGRIMLNRDRIERLGLHLADMLDDWMIEKKGT